VEAEPPTALLTVGHIARRSGLTTKALRHYDRIGLLPPAAVDSVTGYRRYGADQVVQARKESKPP
jgi:DNA-binding transcriptional MerR regulator